VGEAFPGEQGFLDFSTYPGVVMTTPPAALDQFLPPRPDTRRSIRVELSIVFLITLGLSGLYSLVGIIETLIKAAQQNAALSQFHVSVAAPRSTLTVIDLIKQLLDVLRGLAWGALGLYLLWRAGISLSERLGLNRRRLGWDAGAGFVLAAVIGIPGLGLYLLAQRLNLSLTVDASTLTDTWWRVPVTVLIAIENGFLEEVLVVGYLITRLQQLRLRSWAAVGGSALLRGSYHLYQGFGGFLGNVVMGVVFGAFFLRFKRLWPLIVAHTLIDTVTLVGYPLLKGHVSWLP